MNGLTRPARSDEVARLWPAVRAAHIARTAEEFIAYHRDAPWRVRVTEKGESVVLGVWREHLGIATIRGLWAPPHRVVDLVRDVTAVVRAQGLASIMSPLLPESELAPYREAGLTEVHRVVAIQGPADTVVERCARACVRPLVRVRTATELDVDEIAELDALSFPELWAYGRREIADAVSQERVRVAQQGGAIVGYASVALRGSTATLGRLAVSHEARRRGVGRALLADAAAWAVRSDATGIALCTQLENTGARLLYSSAGLCEIKEPYALLLTAV